MGIGLFGWGIFREELWMNGKEWGKGKLCFVVFDYFFCVLRVLLLKCKVFVIDVLN